MLISHPHCFAHPSRLLDLTLVHGSVLRYRGSASHKPHYLTQCSYCISTQGSASYKLHRQGLFSAGVGVQTRAHDRRGLHASAGKDGGGGRATLGEGASLNGTRFNHPACPFPVYGPRRNLLSPPSSLAGEYCTAPHTEMCGLLMHPCGSHDASYAVAASSFLATLPCPACMHTLMHRTAPPPRPPCTATAPRGILQPPAVPGHRQPVLAGCMAQPRQ